MYLANHPGFLISWVVWRKKAHLDVCRVPRLKMLIVPYRPMCLHKGWDIITLKHCTTLSEGVAEIEEHDDSAYPPASQDANAYFKRTYQLLLHLWSLLDGGWWFTQTD